MNIIRPFQGCFYNSNYLKDLKNLICPPYDVIDEERRKFFRKKSVYNFCHLLFAERNKNYRKIKERFKKWFEDNIFSQDKEDFFYLYKQFFFWKGKGFTRTGFFALLDLEKNRVFPHESTLDSPKKDRFNVLKEVRANLDPVFLISQNKINVLEEIKRVYQRKPPFINFRDEEGVSHRLWRIKEDIFKERLIKEVNSKKFFIADGHHRFAVACQFYHQYKNKIKGARFFLCYFTYPQKGLVILPTHRIVKITEKISSFLQGLCEIFYIKPVKKDFFEKKKFNLNGICLGMYKKGRFYLLKLKKEDTLDKIFKKRRENILYKRVDSYLLDLLVLERTKFEKIEYVHKIEELERIVDKDKRKIGFILKKPSLDVIFLLAEKKLLLPQKSTYFYPKLPSGLILRRFEDENI